MEEDDEKELGKFILNQYTWDRLPPNIKKKLEGGSREVWKEKVITYSIKHQIRWKTNLVKDMVVDERSYYLKMIKLSKQNFMLYPYHLSDVLVKSLRITPFKYYLEMMQDVMKNEFSYDKLPNFTATDCVRLLGIGRNEFIDIMNKCRSRGWIWRMNKNIVRDFLPSFPPADIEIEHWWIVNIGFVGEDDIKNCTDGEHTMIDQLIDSGPKEAGTFNKTFLRLLHNKGLIYMDVPINDDDYIAVPPLENFVMNRVGGDFFENLLYQIFVSTDERTSVHQLSQMLDIEVEMVKQAISVYCRLGFAKKKNIEPLPLSFGDKDSASSKWHISWIAEAMGRSIDSDISSSVQNTKKLIPDQFVFETNSASNVDAGSANILTSTSPVIPPLRSSTRISNSPPIRLSGFFHSADSPSNGSPLLSANTANPFPTGFIGNVARKRIGFVFDYTLTALLMMGNLGMGLKAHAVTMYEVGKLPDESIDDFLIELDKVQSVSEGEAQRYHDHALALRQTLRFLRYNKDVLQIEGCDGGVDLLRCERLTSLETATRERILNLNYALLISMAPISSETQAITSCIPLHFGPAIPEVNSVWFKLYLYHILDIGPPCLFFTRGQRVRKLPELFQNCQLVKLYSWKHDTVTVMIRNLLPILNESLLESPVLVQGLSTSLTSEYLDVPFPVETSSESSLSSSSVDVSNAECYTAENISSHPIVQKLHRLLNLHCSFGFIRMLKWEKAISPLRTSFLYHANEMKRSQPSELSLEEHSIPSNRTQWLVDSVFFGIPLSDLRLNEAVCSRIEKFKLFTEENLSKQSRLSRELSLNLLDFISEQQGSKDYENALNLDPNNPFVPYPIRQCV